MSKKPQSNSEFIDHSFNMSLCKRNPLTCDQLCRMTQNYSKLEYTFFSVIESFRMHKNSRLKRDVKCIEENRMVREHLTTLIRSKYSCFLLTRGHTWNTLVTGNELSNLVQITRCWATQSVIVLRLYAILLRNIISGYDQHLNEIVEMIRFKRFRL